MAGGREREPQMVFYLGLSFPANTNVSETPISKSFTQKETFGHLNSARELLTVRSRQPRRQY